MLSPLVPEPAQRRIRRFVDDVFVPRTYPANAGGGPSNMLVGPPQSGGWQAWQPVESPVTDADILDLERQIGAPLPPLFRAWLMYKCLLMTDLGLVRLPSTPSDDPFGPIREYVHLLNEQPYFRTRRVVPFADDGNDTGPLCFDLSRPLPDGDYPVLVFDHHILHRPEYAGRPFADSFAALLDMLEADMLSFDQPEAGPAEPHAAADPGRG